MVDDAGAAKAQGDEWTPAQSLSRLLRSPLPAPRIRTRPWWFPVQDLRDPLVFYLEAWLADSIFGPDRAVIPEMEWMSQVLLTVDIVNSGDLVEITIFGRPRVQNRVKSVLLSLASWHQKLRARAEKMKQLEEFLKARASEPQTPEHPVAQVFSGAL
ncbi:oocyte-expressed protein homolog [Mustela nigripes]|uniref:Oocyte- and embryo-specific protein 19 n=2 Tax=Mustela putorius furo TaxID=9669 RepID=A0A8U0N6U0_MUSPF|nr:oocyte-expressed protein homolog [Mustela putorius furo]XP_059257520.1 oocyte-expressed protein homolog [Mustela nigripes]